METGIDDAVVLPHQLFAPVATDALKRLIAIGNHTMAISFRHNGVDVNRGGQCTGLLQCTFQPLLCCLGLLYGGIARSNCSLRLFCTQHFTDLQCLRRCYT